MGKHKRDSTQRNHATDRDSIRAWTAGVTASEPECDKCTWVLSGGQWRLKFVNRACRQHRHLT